MTVTQKDQTATGERGLFDMQANTVTLIGNVVVTQGQNVMRGERLVVDLTTGVSRVDAGKGPVAHADPAGAAAGQGRPGCFGQARLTAFELSGHRGARRLKACRRAPITARRLRNRPAKLDSRRA